MNIIYNFEPSLGYIAMAYKEDNTVHIISKYGHIKRKIYSRDGSDYIRLNNELFKIIYA